MATAPASLSQVVDQYATDLVEPGLPSADQPWRGQSLTNGSAGIALLHVERAHAGTGTWQHAHRWIETAVSLPLSASDTAGLYQGVPAVALLLDAAAAGHPWRYLEALATIDTPVTALAHRRADAAIERINTGALPGFREYDVFFGLTGIGALLLRRWPGSSAMERILHYLVELTHPLRVDDHFVPGWWVGHDPHRRQSDPYQSGHGNMGMAHGISGPLALLSKAMRCGVTVNGQQEAISTICDWLDIWRQDSDAGPWWPEWITLNELRRGRPRQLGPARPSWCYGTPGIARAGQLAGIATSNMDLQQRFERALFACLRDPVQQSRITDHSLCHGWAGIYQTLWRAAADDSTSELAGLLAHVTARLARPDEQATAPTAGLLEGAAGTALALNTAAHQNSPICGWDTCLLID